MGAFDRFSAFIWRSCSSHHDHRVADACCREPDRSSRVCLVLLLPNETVSACAGLETATMTLLLRDEHGGSLGLLRLLNPRVLCLLPDIFVSFTKKDKSFTSVVIVEETILLTAVPLWVLCFEL